MPSLREVGLHHTYATVSTLEIDINSNEFHILSIVEEYNMVDIK